MISSAFTNRYVLSYQLDLVRRDTAHAWASSSSKSSVLCLNSDSELITLKRSYDLLSLNFELLDSNAITNSTAHRQSAHFLAFIRNF